jgi:hypothetical protein
MKLRKASIFASQVIKVSGEEGRFLIAKKNENVIERPGPTSGELLEALANDV